MDKKRKPRWAFGVVRFPIWAYCNVYEHGGAYSVAVHKTHKSATNTARALIRCGAIGNFRLVQMGAPTEVYLTQVARVDFKDFMPEDIFRDQLKRSLFMEM